MNKATHMMTVIYKIRFQLNVLVVNCDKSIKRWVRTVMLVYRALLSVRSLVLVADNMS